MSELFVVNGICGGTVFFLPDVPTVLGRSPECHVQIADPWISSMHALFERRGPQLWVVDLDSRNGTFVDEERVQEARVAPGSRLRFGKTSAELRLASHRDTPPSLLSDQRTVIRYIADLAAELPRPAATGPDLAGAVAAAAALPRQETSRGPSSTGVARRQIAVLNEVARNVSSAGALDEALRGLMRVLAQALGAERSSVLLLDERGEMVSFLADPADRPPRLSDTVLEATLRSRAGILTLDAQQDARFAASASVISQGIRSCICAPVWADNRILGVLLLERGSADPFNADDLELATLVGFQAALAVERARLGERARAAEEQRALLLRYLDPAAAAPLVATDAERELLSPALRGDLAALSVTLVGAEAVAAATSAEEGARRAATLQRALAAAALEAGAAVDARLDGGVLAVFGLPRALPDGGARALRCAAALVARAVAMEELHAAPRLTVKVGVDVGPALAGNFGTPDRPELRATGGAVEAAHRLAVEAAPGEVLCGPGATAAAPAVTFAPGPRPGAFRLG